MARLWRDQGKRDEARELLAPVYGWFSEGFDTLDLKEAVSRARDVSRVSHRVFSAAGKLLSFMVVRKLSGESWLSIGGTYMRRTTLLLSAFVLIVPFGFTIVSAQAAESASIIQSAALTWAPAQGFPPGAQIAVLYGDPSKNSPFALRLKFPAGYE
jgi:hypothetical protein